MKIGIVTFWTSNDNYGQLLQCWALQYRLIELGHEPFLIRTHITVKPVSKWYIKIVKILLVIPLITKIYRTISGIREKELLRQLSLKNEVRQFEKFRKDYLVVSERDYFSIAQLRENPPIADCYMTGSDQTWNQLPCYDDNLAYFLDFGDSGILRVSYAPSFAMKEYPEKCLNQLYNLLAKYNAISVREKDGVDICRSVGIKASHVLDPTMLLGKNDYLRMFKLKNRQSTGIYLYSINVKHSEEIRWSELKKFASGKGMGIKITPGSGLCPGYEIYGSDMNYEYSTIPQWLENIYNAELVITTSFHGVVFSILMETPFIYIPLKGERGKGNNRVFELLDKFGLEDRIMNSYRSYASIFSSKPNNVVNSETLERLRTESIIFLKTHLN